ncbi:MAG: 6-phosphogluconolactonase [Planctomycetes bacterium]|nr:6-phosphogluconolactonase [Planctomycetota bacterium]
MTEPRIRIFPTRETLFDEAADLFVRAVERAGERAGVAIPGGRTPAGLFEALLDRAPSPWPGWEKVHIFFGDERCVPPDHPDSNYGLAKRLLLDPIGIAPARVHRMRGEAEDPDEAARAYEGELTATVPEGRLDLIVLGMGADGHTASLFPGTPALREERRLVVANTAAHGVARRLTLTLPALRRARRIVFLVAGEEKADAVVRALGGRPDERLPASLVAPDEGELVWMLDRGSASRLARRGS